MVVVKLILKSFAIGFKILLNLWKKEVRKKNWKKKKKKKKEKKKNKKKKKKKK
jgi:uncharacterized membrane protein